MTADIAQKPEKMPPPNRQHKNQKNPPSRIATLFNKASRPNRHSALSFDSLLEGFDALHLQRGRAVSGGRSLGSFASNMITVRDAVEADLPAIIDIYNASIPSGLATADTQAIAVSDRVEWFKKFDPGKRPIWVAEDQGHVVGCVYLSWFYGGRPAYDETAEISTYIAPEYQRRGLGTMLKKKMIDACPRLGVVNLISMYFDHNVATQRLNDKLGFQPMGHLPEIAEVFGEKRGLKISILRIQKGEQCG